MTISPAAPTAPAGFDPAQAAMRVAREETTAFFTHETPPGCAGAVLDQATRVWEQLDQITYQMLRRLAQIEASGALLDQGGQTTLERWLRHAFGIAPAHATDLARLARADARQTMPATTQAFAQGKLSLGEAAAVVKGVEAATENRDTQAHPDADLFRAQMECGVLAVKEQRPATSVAQLARVAHQLAVRLNPDRAERDHEAAHAARGARLSTTFGGSFLFQAWGSAADVPLLEAALAGYAAPYTPGEATSKSERTYDAFVNMARFAQSHQECTTPTTPAAIVNITVAATTLAGAQGEDPATTQDGRVVPVSLVREVLPQSLVRRLITDHKSGTVLDVGRTYRLAPPRIRAAAFHGHTTCAWQHGCDVPVGLAQADHIVEFCQGGTTSAANIQPLCSTHNRLKHRWGLRRDRTMWSGRTPGRNRD